jgi:hypothetical protein
MGIWTTPAQSKKEPLTSNTFKIIEEEARKEAMMTVTASSLGI